jgi:hypothetical protein
VAAEGWILHVTDNIGASARSIEQGLRDAVLWRVAHD